MGGGKGAGLWGVTEAQGELASAEEVAQYAGCSPLVGRLLWNRGYRDREQIDRLLKPQLSQLPSPFEIIDMEHAVDRVCEALANDEPIAVYGDYDVDGTCGAAILSEFLGELGAGVTTYQPNRFKEGYGVNVAAVTKLAEAGARVIISVDCGITAVEPARVLKERGCDYIVLDHHLPGETLPEAYALVDPQRAEDTTGLHNLCGAGLAFFFIMGLRTKLRDADFFTEGATEPNLLKYLDLVAAATVADVADIRGVNRILVAHGLRVLNRQPRLGFKALLEVAQVKEVRSFHLGFVIGPRINAAGRLESAQAALKLLGCQDPKEARALATQLDEINQARRGTQDGVVDAARAQAKAQLDDPRLKRLAERLPAASFGPWPRALVLAAEDWHEGVVGIVASKIMEEFGRPVFVLTRKDDKYKGSARSLAKIDIFSVMQAPMVAQYLTNYGGHAFAGGATMMAESLWPFTEAVNEHLALTTTGDHYRIERRFDIELTEADLTAPVLTRLAQELEMLEPFGNGFPDPVFQVRASLGDLRVMKERHLKFRLGGVDAVWFGALGGKGGATEPRSGASAKLWVAPQWNEWNGRRSLQLRVTHGEILPS